MESDSYKEYYRTKRSKISLAFWVLINNNVISQNAYISFMTLDFLFQFLFILCLYDSVGAVPPLS